MYIDGGPEAGETQRNGMRMTYNSLDTVIGILTRTPGILRSMLDELPQTLLDANEGPGTFSPRDVVGHLIHAEKTDWIPRIEMILATGESLPFPPFDRFGFKDAIKGKPISELLKEFSDLRISNLRYLDSLNLNEDLLRRKGKHPEFGPVTMAELISTWGVHDLNHIGQVVRVISNSYRSDVGPWQAYLGILKER